LVAEYKETTQFLHLVRKRVEEGHPMDDLPSAYCLNRGHCKFFYDKGLYIYNRYTSLKEEMERRNLVVNQDLYLYNRDRIRAAYSSELFNDYTPSVEDYTIVIDRIGYRIKEKPHLYPDMHVFFDNTQYYGVPYESTPNLTRDPPLIG
jgi:deoxyribonuclease (pyrimidine dimer)